MTCVDSTPNAWDALDALEAIDALGAHDGATALGDEPPPRESLPDASQWYRWVPPAGRGEAAAAVGRAAAAAAGGEVAAAAVGEAAVPPRGPLPPPGGTALVAALAPTALALPAPTDTFAMSAHHGATSAPQPSGVHEQACDLPSDDPPCLPP